MEHKENYTLNKPVEKQISIDYHLITTKAVFNINELCLYTGFSKSHIYKLTCNKRIPFYKKSKHLFFDRVEIENWLRSSRHATAEEIERQVSTLVTLKNNIRG
jgi:excisionase family DNA binding protein